MFDELLPECATLVSILHTLFVAHAAEANTLDDDSDTLVIEVSPG